LQKFTRFFFFNTIEHTLAIVGGKVANLCSDKHDILVALLWVTKTIANHDCIENLNFS